MNFVVRPNVGVVIVQAVVAADNESLGFNVVVAQVNVSRQEGVVRGPAEEGGETGTAAEHQALWVVEQQVLAQGVEWAQLLPLFRLAEKRLLKVGAVQTVQADTEEPWGNVRDARENVWVAYDEAHG
jgi:hypothetical protein